MLVEDIGQVVVHRADNVLVALSVAIDVILGPQYLLGLGDRDPDGNPVAGVRTLRGSNVKTVGLEPGLYEVDRVGEGAVADGKVVVLDLAGVDADERAALGEVWRVREELVGLGEVDECADAGEEERVELLLRVPLHLLGRLWAVREFARDQIGGGPVRVRDGLWSTRAGGLDGGRWRGG